jgi:hypothetical protein
MGNPISQRKKLHSHAFSLLAVQLIVIGSSTTKFFVEAHTHTISIGRLIRILKCCSHAWLSIDLPGCDWLKHVDLLAGHPSPYDFNGVTTERIKVL